MRFRSFGDLEAPSWLLHETTTLSEISSVRLKLLVKQVIKEILDGNLDWQKVVKFTTAKDDEIDLSATKGTLAAVHFILASAAKYDVDDDSLTKEIEQLGLPKENATAIVRPYRENKTALRTKFANDTFAIHRPLNYTWSREENNDDPSPAYRLELYLEDASSHDIHVSPQKYIALRHELTQVMALMDGNSASAA